MQTEQGAEGGRAPFQCIDAPFSKIMECLRAPWLKTKLLKSLSLPIDADSDSMDNDSAAASAAAFSDSLASAAQVLSLRPDLKGLEISDGTFSTTIFLTPDCIRTLEESREGFSWDRARLGGAIIYVDDCHVALMQRFTGRPSLNLCLVGHR